MAVNDSLVLNSIANASRDPTEKRSDKTNGESKNLLREISGNEQKSRRCCSTPPKIKWRSVFVVIILITDYFLIYSSISLLGAFFPTKAPDKGTSPFVTGVIIGTAPLILTIFSPIVGYFIPKLGIKFTMITGLFTVGGAYVALGPTIYLPSGWPFILVCLVLRFAEGVGTAMFDTAAITVANKLYPESFGFVLGLMEVGIGLGFASGPAIGGYLYSIGGYQTPFLVVGGLTSLFAVITLFSLKGIDGQSKSLLSIKMTFKLMTNFVLCLLMLSVVLQSAGVGFMVATLAVFYKRQFSLTPVRIGVSFLSLSVFYMLSAPVAGKLADKISPRSLIIGGLFVSAVAYQFLGPATFLPCDPMLWLTITAHGLLGVGVGAGLVAVVPDMKQVATYVMVLDSMSDFEDSDTLPAFIAGLVTGCISFGILDQKSCSPTQNFTLHHSDFIGPIIGGGLTEYFDFRESTMLYGEALFAMMVLLLGVSVIDACICNGRFHKKLQSKDESSNSIDRQRTVKQNSDNHKD